MKKSNKPADISIKEYSNKNFNWFPGHMKKAIDEVKKNLRLVDIIFEIRDARSPLVTSNKTFTDQIKNKSRLIIMNKANLANPDMTTEWSNWFSANNEDFMFINGLDKKSLDQILVRAKKIVNDKRRESNAEIADIKKLRVMIIGLPNTGKSTIINSLSNRDATKVADKPGQTQQQLWVKAAPDLDILDTPGIMPPNIHNEEQALWLSAIHAIPDRLTSADDTACYILKHLIQTNLEHLLSFYKIEEKSDDYLEIIDLIAKSRGCIRKKNEYDYDRVFKMILNDFRAGKLGLINFGTPPNS